MSSYTNERGQVVYESEGDMGIACSQGHKEKHGHGILHEVKEGIKEGVHEVKEGVSNLADRITNNPEHDHLSPKAKIVSVERA